MSVITSALQNLSLFLKDHQVSFSNGLLILFTIGGEQIFRFSAFRCPCTQPEAYYYAIIFLFVPALILGILGITVSNLTWRIFHGWRYRSKESRNGFWTTSKYFVIATSRAAIVPCAWLFVTLLDGNYYACMKSSKPCERAEEEFLQLIAESQNISWISLGSVITIAFLVICIARCWDSSTYVQNRYITSYREAEQKQLETSIQECTKSLAEKNVRAFMTQSELHKKDWDDISRAPGRIILLKKERDEGDNPEVMSLTSQTKEPKEFSIVFLTPLHEWASKHTTEVQQQVPETSSV